MNDNVTYIPIWKNNATAEERLQELAQIARKHPERFDKFIIVHQELDEKKEYTQERTLSFNCSTTEAVGLLRLGEVKLLKFDE